LQSLVVGRNSPGAGLPGWDRRGREVLCGQEPANTGPGGPLPTDKQSHKSNCRVLLWAETAAGRPGAGRPGWDHDCRGRGVPVTGARGGCGQEPANTGPGGPSKSQIASMGPGGLLQTTTHTNLIEAPILLITLKNSFSKLFRDRRILLWAETEAGQPGAGRPGWDRRVRGAAGSRHFQPFFSVLLGRQH
jgi:hypothetical protein